MLSLAIVDQEAKKLDTFESVGFFQASSNTLILNKPTTQGIFLPIRFANHGVVKNQAGEVVGYANPSPKGCVIQMMAEITGRFQIEIYSDNEEVDYLNRRDR